MKYTATPPASATMLIRSSGVKPCQSARLYCGDRGAEHGAHGGVEDRTDGQRRGDADDEARQHEKLGREPHQERRLVRRARQVLRSGAEEHVADEAQRIGDREHAGQGDDVGKRLIHERVVVDLDGLGEEHLLGEEAVEQRNAGHRGGGDHGQGRRDRHEAPEAAQATDVARAAFVIDDAGGHEQRRLEGRVVHDVEDRGDLPERGIQPGQKRDQPEVADGRIGEQPLEVLLEDGEERAEDERDQAGRAHEPQPLVGSAHRRPQPDQQEDAGLHHGGRMQVGRDRRRRRHRVRQPEMERELGALGEGAEQNEDQRRNVEGMRADHARRTPAPGRGRSCRRCGRAPARRRRGKARRPT